MRGGSSSREVRGGVAAQAAKQVDSNGTVIQHKNFVNAELQS